MEQSLSFANKMKIRCTLDSPLHPGCQSPPRMKDGIFRNGNSQPLKPTHLATGTLEFGTCGAPCEQWLFLVPLIGVGEDVVSFKLYILIVRNNRNGTVRTCWRAMVRGFFQVGKYSILTLQKRVEQTIISISFQAQQWLLRFA